jgi:hypothetical protein
VKYHYEHGSDSSVPDRLDRGDFTFSNAFSALGCNRGQHQLSQPQCKSAHNQLCVTAANAVFCLSLGKREAVAPPFLQLGVELHVWNHGNLRQKVKWGEGFQLARGALGDQSAVAVPETLVRSAANDIAKISQHRVTFAGGFRT